MSQSAVNNPFTVEETAGGPREWEAILLRLIGKVYTMTLVKVNSVQAGGTGAAGFVSATDLIQQMDGNNRGIPNVPMHNLPYFRLQGGGNAVIIDPKPGDIGLAVFAQRDISEAKRSKTEGAPPSLRAHDVSDGLYIGGVLNGAPSQWVRFLDSGIEITATGPVTINTPGDLTINSTGDVKIESASLTHNGVNVGSSHVHGGITPGGQNTQGPQ